MILTVIGENAEQRQIHQKRRRLEIEPDSQVNSDVLKEAAASYQFELLATLVRELQEMKWQLGQIAADVTVKQKPAGIVGTTRAPCRICHGHGNDQRVEDDGCDGESTFSDEESQRPLKY